MAQINGLMQLLDTIEDNIEQLQKQPMYYMGSPVFKMLVPLTKKGRKYQRRIKRFRRKYEQYSKTGQQ